MDNRAAWLLAIGFTRRIRVLEINYKLLAHEVTVLQRQLAAARASAASARSETDVARARESELIREMAALRSELANVKRDREILAAAMKAKRG